MSQDLANYWDRVWTNTMNIEIRNVNYSDVGYYTLRDRSSRVVSVTRMDLTGGSRVPTAAVLFAPAGFHSSALIPACVGLRLQISMNTQGETLCWASSSCWAFRPESAAAVARRFSSRKPPPRPRCRYAHQSAACVLKPPPLSQEVNKQGRFLPAGVDGCVVFYMSMSDVSGDSSHLRPQRPRWTLSSLQHPWTTRSCKIAW